MSQFDLQGVPDKRAVFIAWWNANAAKLSPEIRAQGPAIARMMQNAEMGDIWKDIKNNILAKIGEGVKQIADKVGENAPQMAKAAAEYKIIRENIKRIDAGQSPLNVSDVSGFGDIKTLMWGGLALVGIMMFKRR